MEVCEATSITGQGFADTAYFRDVYLRDQLTDAKHQIPSPNYPYPVAQHQHIYENASTFPVSYTTTAPSTIASGYPLSSFMSETHLHHQHQEYQTVSTFEHFYPKEIDKDQVYANHHHLQQQQQQQQQRIPPQHLPPYTSNSALSTNINPKNIIDEYKTSPFTLPEEVTTPYICKANDVMYSLPISNEKQECTLNNANNLCNALLLNTDTSISQWDVNDPKLPKIRQFDTFTMWPQGHCRYAYKKSQSEGAKRHASGWAMRNTNNHNSQILKKSCLGVLLCTSKQCTLAMRPAICDKARRRQEGRPCCMPNCNGRIYIQSCHGHGGYPVTHFWREHGDTIYFQAKGTHDHIRPDLKPVRDTAARRRKQQLQQQQQQQQQQGHVEEQVCRKIPRLTNMKSVKTFEHGQQNEVNTRLHSTDCSVYSNKTSRIGCQNQEISQFSQTNYKRKINGQNSNLPTSLDHSYSDVNMKKEPIFPGSNPFETNEYSNISTTLKTTPPSPMAITPATPMPTIKSPQFPISSNNLLETTKNPSITSPPSLISTPGPLETKINPITTTITPPTILNQSYDNHNLYQYNTSLELSGNKLNLPSTTPPTTMGIKSSIFPSVIDYKTNKSTNRYDTFVYNNPQDIVEVNDIDYYQSKHVSLAPFNFTASTTTTTSMLSTSPSASAYGHHFMNQLMMNSSLPANNNNNNNSTTNMNTTYNNINNNSNTCGTNSESTSCGLNASWSTPSPPTCGLGNSSLFSNNDIRTLHSGVDEISSKKLLSSNDSLKELQSSILNNIQEGNTNLSGWSDNCDPVVNVNGTGNNHHNNEDISNYYQPANQYLHNSYYSTYMHKLNLAGYHLTTTPNNQYYFNELPNTTNNDINNNNNNNNSDSFSPIDQTSLTPSIFMSSSTPVSTMTSKTMNKLYRSTNNQLYDTPTSRLLRATEENSTNIDNMNNNSNPGFGYIAPIPFYLNSSSDSRSTRTDSSSDTSQCKQIMI